MPSASSRARLFFPTSGMIIEYLAITRPESGAATLHAAGKVEGILQRPCSLVGPVAAQRNIQLTLKLDVPPPALAADAVAPAGEITATL